jgi:hypothetical protein
LILLFSALVLMAIFSGLGAVAAGLADQRKGGPGDDTQVLLVVVGCIAILAGLVGLAGLGLCCAVPGETGATKFAVASVVAFAIWGVTLFVGVPVMKKMIEDGLRLGRMTRTDAIFNAAVFGCVVGAVLFASQVLVAFFLRALALFFQNLRLARYLFTFCLASGGLFLLRATQEFSEYLSYKADPRSLGSQAFGQILGVLTAAVTVALAVLVLHVLRAMWLRSETRD